VAAYHAQHIRRGHTVLAVVGDVQPDEAAAVLDGAFADLVYEADQPLPAVVWPAERHASHETRAKQQTALALLFPGPSRTAPERHAARVLSAIASGLGGRFFEQLRDRQSLAYTVTAFPVERRAGGAFAAYIATSPAREDEARDGLLQEFARFVNEPPTSEEVERARRYLIGTHAIAQQSGGAVLGDLVDAWLFGEGLYERHEVDARLEAVTAADVQSVARQYFDPAVVAEGVVRGTA
jgi:zinc protease